MIKGADLIPVFSNVFFHSSIFFLAFVMLTEPLTTPPTHVLQVLYGVMVGILYIPQLHIGNLYTTPEIALVLGNVFSYIVSPKTKIIAYVAQRLKLTPDTFDFIFGLDKKLSFIPGQYMEWTLQHPNSDSRGNRRYFTIASSPTENNVRLGIKFYQPASSFKKALLSMTPQSLPIVGTQIAGDFTLPQNPSKKLVFLAGGIGITPFRSMLKYLIDTNQARDIVLLYSNKNISEIVYQDVLTQAQMQLKIKVLYTLTDTSALPAQWQGKVGRVNPEMIQQEIPDYRERIFYLSGPHAMVKGFESVLHSMGVSKSQIKTDFFPGFV
jgi:ferredoxin-NADP reductase